MELYSMGKKMKLYQSEEWLYRRYVVQKKSVTEIAIECKSSAMTIQRYLTKFGLIKRR
jgi:hypothetical protein